MIINHMNQTNTLGTTFLFKRNGAKFCPSRRLCNDPSNQIKRELANQGSANG
jgi:hypothetical protein